MHATIKISFKTIKSLFLRNNLLDCIIGIFGISAFSGDRRPATRNAVFGVRRHQIVVNVQHGAGFILVFRYVTQQGMRIARKILFRFVKLPDFFGK